MEFTGIICEYNPLHKGHKKQIDHIKQQGQGVVCLMSGNFVQRGHPAVFDKITRAKAAVASGADLVLELPISYAICSAEGFAAGGVQILSKLCHNICFGAETADANQLMHIAKVLLTDTFSEKLRIQLEKGCSFPAARSAALADCGVDSGILETPNNILAVEYCKAILLHNSSLKPMVIHRKGNYHDLLADGDNPSATSLRRLIESGESWQDFVPAEAQASFQNATIHTLAQGERAILYRLRTMTEEEYEALPYGSEGLWRKLMHASRSCSTLADIIEATKSKRYTRTRIDRMILCAYLGITAAQLAAPAPHCRVLAFNDNGRKLLGSMKDTGFFRNIGEKTGSEYEALEHRCSALYGLFADRPDTPTAEGQYRIHYKK